MTTEKTKTQTEHKQKINKTHRFCEREQVSLLECTTLHVASQEGHQHLYIYI